MNSDAIFYIRLNDKKKGPFTEEEFIKCIHTEVIEPDCEIQIEGMEKWLQLKDTIYSFYLKNSGIEVTDVYVDEKSQSIE